MRNLINFINALQSQLKTVQSSRLIQSMTLTFLFPFSEFFISLKFALETCKIKVFSYRFLSTHKKFMIFNINHFGIAAHRIKWTDDAINVYKWYLIFSISFKASLNRITFEFWCNERSLTFCHSLKYVRYQHKTGIFEI